LYDFGHVKKDEEIMEFYIKYEKLGEKGIIMEVTYCRPGYVDQ